MDLHSQIVTAYKAIDEDLETAKFLAQSAEERVAEADSVKSETRSAFGALLIDLGTMVRDEGMIERGTCQIEQVIRDKPLPEVNAPMYYNAGNGYGELWKLRSRRCIEEGYIDDSYMKAKCYYQKALKWIQGDRAKVDTTLHVQLLVNFANLFDSIGRHGEALRFYDKALELRPDFGEALGNKAILLSFYAFLLHGYTHLYLLESQKLLGQALASTLDPQMKETFGRTLDRVNAIVEAHSEMQPEDVSEVTLRSPFHEHLHSVCSHYGLYLCPGTHITTLQGRPLGDPMFVKQLYSPLTDGNRTDRYITFLNEIKQDYVLARFLFIQSQYRTENIDIVDLGLSQYYPLDYSMNSTYVQLLKTSYVTAVNLLDKAANFVWDYCEVASLSRQRDVNFRSIWSDQNSSNRLRPELASRQNFLLLALLDMAMEFSAKGRLSKANILRNALTHRFLVVHDMMPNEQENSDIPRILHKDLVEECITILQLARSAIMYLILFVDSEERKREDTGPVVSIPLISVDEIWRWKPHIGDIPEA